MIKGVGRRFSRRERKKRPKNSKKRLKNCTFKHLSTIFVPCLKIQEGARPPAADAHADDDFVSRNVFCFSNRINLYLNSRLIFWKEQTFSLLFIMQNRLASDLVFVGRVH